jgi:hypothetical protein
VVTSKNIIVGCKLSSNALKEWSEARADFMKKREKIEKSITFIINKHKKQDKGDGYDTDIIKKEEKSIRNLKAKKEKIDRWLEVNKDKTGYNGKPIQSNITDNESAKMLSSKGVIQGYNGIAMVDDKTQVVVNAEAFGSGSEHKYLISMVDGTNENFKVIGTDDNVFEKTILTADSGNHSEENMKDKSQFSRTKRMMFQEFSPRR